VLDLETEGRVANEAMVREIDVRKTGALMSAALRLGGLAGEAGRSSCAAGGAIEVIVDP